MARLTRLTRRRATGAATMLVMAAVLTGCSSDGDATASPFDPSSSPPSVAHPEHSDQSVAGAGTDPAAAAAEVVRRWGRPELKENTWWAELEPVLSPGGVQRYSGTDPSQVPALKVTGTHVDQVSETYAVVSVATNRGKVPVTLTRLNTASGWRATQMGLSAVLADR